MIVLDSNQLRYVLPGKPALKLLEVAAKQAGHTLATTDVVIREVTRQQREVLTDAIARLRTAQRAFNKEARPAKKLTGNPFDKLTAAFIDEEVGSFETALRKRFHVLETARMPCQPLPSGCGGS